MDGVSRRIIKSRQAGAPDGARKRHGGGVCGAKTVKKSFGRERQKRSNDGRDGEEGERRCERERKREIPAGYERF